MQQKKKICMLGASAVGKTSLVRQFVERHFSDKWRTTVGVRVDKKVVHLGEDEVMLMLWDIFGKDDYQDLKVSQLSGAAGFLLVVDGTRRVTLDKALDLDEQVKKALGPTPTLLVMNKVDLAADWEITPEIDQELRGRGWQAVRSSAKTGEGVEEAFVALAHDILGKK